MRHNDSRSGDPWLVTGRFTPQLLDDIRARLSVSQVVGRKVALKKAGREWRGLSPFKVEKTPSFYVNDQKGFYHCFASGEHGDIFTFLMKTEGLDFPEAVERLAEEAGVPLPKKEERSPEIEDQRDRLYRLLETSARFFEDQYRTPLGAESRRYLEKRGLAQQTITAFRLGYAPNGRQALRQHLKEKGFNDADMASSGMIIAGPDIAEPYDRFRNRVMFPILDMKGRVIAFGGRALDKEAQAKYLNSPETPLFHKGHQLFNALRARPLAHDKGRIIVVEGYMDVVALHEGGFGEAVAPLGTALTEDQVKLLWRFAQEPTLCFDGDSAGKKAAFRAIDTALPYLKPGHSLRFAFLPDGLDPDDLIRQQGSDAMSSVLERTRPLIDVLWERETGSGPLITPEQRAALEARLRQLTNSIGDAIVRAHYDRELRDRLFAFGRTSRPAGGAASNRAARTIGGSYVGSPKAAEPDWRQRERTRLFGRPNRAQFLHKQREAEAHAGASPALSGLVHSAPPREALILKIFLNHPALIDEYAEALGAMTFTSRPLGALRNEILNLHATQNSLDSATLRTQLSKTGVSKVVDLVARTITHISDRFAEPEASATEVEAGLRHVLMLHQHQEELERMVKAAEDAFCKEGTVEAEARLLDLKRQITQMGAAEHLENTSYTHADPSAATATRAS